MNVEWRVSSRNIYLKAEDFLRAFGDDTLPDGFSLSESVFGELLAIMAANHVVAEQIARDAIILALKAANGAEVAGLIEMAESFCDKPIAKVVPDPKQDPDVVSELCRIWGKEGPPEEPGLHLEA